jgi:hypothetical protein
MGGGGSTCPYRCTSSPKQWARSRARSLAARHCPHGYGTAFEALLERFAGLPEEAAVVFTDGESGCSADWGDKLRGAGKRL